MRLAVLIFCSAVSVRSALFCQNLNDTAVFNKFIGTWRWVNQADTFDVKLLKDTIPRYFTNSVTYNIYGFHRLVENGRLIENSFTDNNDFVLKNATIVGNNLGKDTLKLIAIDKIRHRNYTVVIKLAGSLDVANWKKIKENERVIYISKEERRNAKKPLSKKTIPDNVMLKKIDD